jgi:hypothetical protein
MSAKIDLRTLPANVPVLCIPRVYSNIGENRIRRIFEDLDMGDLDRIDVVSKVSEKGEKFNRVYVHFRRWSNSDNANMARERLLEGKDIKIVYDDPWFWKVSAYREVVARPRQRDIQRDIQRDNNRPRPRDDRPRPRDDRPRPRDDRPRNRDDRPRNIDDRPRNRDDQIPPQRHIEEEMKNVFIPRSPSNSPPRQRINQPQEKEEG